MSGYAKTIEKFHEQGAVAVRTDYRCAAQGCPNMGGIAGRFGVDRSGMCYFHYTADPLKWGEVTRQILADDTMLDPLPTRPSAVADKEKDGPRAWAWALKKREEAADRLTPAQKVMWRSALPAHRREPA